MSSGSSIVQERLLQATPEEVFQAFGEAESLSVWMCPAEGMKPATVDLDFRVGGRFRITMHGDDQDYVQTGEYLEIDPPRRLVMTWVSHWMSPAEQQTRLTITIEAAGDGTRLRLEHDELPPGDAYAGHNDGWARILGLVRAHWEE